MISLHFIEGLVGVEKPMVLTIDFLLFSYSNDLIRTNSYHIELQKGDAFYEGNYHRGTAS